MFGGAPTKGTVYVFSGSNVPQHEEGIFMWVLHGDSGALECVGSFKGVDSPTFLAVHPSGTYLYAVSETVKADGEAGGKVFAFKLAGFGKESPKEARLEILNSVRSKGAYPCHLSIDACRNQLIVSNYGDGVLTVVRILPDGSLGEVLQEIHYAGQGKNPVRQECSHIHSSLISSADNHIYVADLGLDRVYHYSADDQDSLLTPKSPLYLEVPSGCGPRHAVFSSDRQFLYLVEELSNEVSVCSIDSATGMLGIVQTLSTLPGSYNGPPNLAADIHVSPNGKFLYVSNRGHDSIAIFRVDAASSGNLHVVGWESVQGKSPRNFMIDASGRWLVVANTETDSLVTFSMNPLTGLLNAVSQVTVKKPMCVLLVPDTNLSLP
jgi:6-phosphogluconolactonase